MASKIWIALFSIGCRYYELHLDLHFVCFASAGARRVVALATPPRWQLFKSSRPSSRNSLLGAKLSSRTTTWDHVDARWCRRNAVWPWCCIDCCDQRNNKVHITTNWSTSYVDPKEERGDQRTHVPGMVNTEESQPRKGRRIDRRIRREKKAYVRPLWLVRSWPKSVESQTE